MSTTDNATTGSDRERPALLEEGPLHDALVAISAARAEIEAAKAAFRERREAFSGVLRAQMEAFADGPEEYTARFAPVIGALYWDEPTVRVTDIAAATGLSSDQIRRVAGPRRVQVACQRCGAATEALQSSRSRPPHALCPACRAIIDEGDLGAGLGPTGGNGGPWSSYAMADHRRWLLEGLVDHLAQVLQEIPCDHSLVQTRRWALDEGLDPDAVTREVRNRDAYCDCEVVFNLPGSSARRSR